MDGPILVFTGFLLVAVVLGLLLVSLPRLLAPRHASKLKSQTYECGEVPTGEARIQFSFQYYIFALIFVVFDSLSIFVLVWALVLPGLDLVARLYMLMFILVLLGVLVHALKKEEAVHI